VTLLLHESSGIIESLLYYGIRSFSCFYLLASSSIPTLHAFLDKIQASIANHTDPHMLLASRNMELILLHFQYLLITITSSPASPSSASSSLADLTLCTHHLVTLFVSFLKKSLKLPCWKQQFTANPTLGRSLVRCLVILSVPFPFQTLKIIENCTSKDLFASSPTAASSPALLSLSSVLGEIQLHLLNLQSTISSNIGACARSTSCRRPRPPGPGEEESRSNVVTTTGTDGISETDQAEKRPRLK
jgi:hypothetical protein